MIDCCLTQSELFFSYISWWEQVILSSFSAISWREQTTFDDDDDDDDDDDVRFLLDKRVWLDLYSASSLK